MHFVHFLHRKTHVVFQVFGSGQARTRSSFWPKPAVLVRFGWLRMSSFWWVRPDHLARRSYRGNLPSAGIWPGPNLAILARFGQIWSDLPWSAGQLVKPDQNQPLFEAGFGQFDHYMAGFGQNRVIFGQNGLFWPVFRQGYEVRPKILPNFWPIFEDRRFRRSSKSQDLGNPGISGIWGISGRHGIGSVSQKPE